MPGHCSWNHWPPDVNAPHPQDPEASEVSVAWKRPCPKLDIGHDPFQIGKKQPHHLRSERKPELRVLDGAARAHSLRARSSDVGRIVPA